MNTNWTNDESLNFCLNLKSLKLFCGPRCPKRFKEAKLCTFVSWFVLPPSFCQAMQFNLWLCRQACERQVVSVIELRNVHNVLKYLRNKNEGFPWYLTYALLNVSLMQGDVTIACFWCVFWSSSHQLYGCPPNLLTHLGCWRATFVFLIWMRMVCSRSGPCRKYALCLGSPFPMISAKLCLLQITL